MSDMREADVGSDVGDAPPLYTESTDLGHMHGASYLFGK